MTDTRLNPQDVSGPRYGGPLRWVEKLKTSMTVNLRVMTYCMMLAVAVVPIAIFYNWVERTSFDNELSHVDENHLIIAKNMSAALSRYATDAMSTFDFVVAQGNSETDPTGFANLLAKFDLCHVMILSPKGALTSQIMGNNMHDKGMPTIDTVQHLRELGAANPGKTVVSKIIKHGNSSHFFIVKQLKDGSLAFAPWSPRYVMQLQASIAFGELGHSMIVDHTGLVVAHPNAEWQRINKDASKLPPVQAMLAGKTGVMQFYSPPLAADMIAGYTYVPETGWGVMVPQPISELEDRAGAVQRTALYMSTIVVTLAAMVSLWFSQVLTSPILSVVSSARNVAEGNLSARVKDLPRYSPGEIRLLADTFNEMIHDIEKKTAQLTENLYHEKQLSNERATLLAEAQRANAVKSQFVSTVSHELRTPLTSIRGSLELLDKGVTGELPEKAKDLNRIAIKNADRLQLMIDDLLDLEKLDSGKIVFRVDSVDLNQLVSDSVEANESYAKLHDTHLNWTPADKPVMVAGDANRLMQVMANLLSNAAKFSPTGRDVDIWLETKDDRVRVFVRDHGLGIAKINREKIFERFVQLDATDTRRYGGTGLGLSITRMIVENHDGEIGLDSTIGEGSTFWFDLPIEADEA